MARRNLPRLSPVVEQVLDEGARQRQSGHPLQSLVVHLLADPQSAQMHQTEGWL